MDELVTTTVKESALRELVRAGAIKELCLSAIGAGFAVRVHYANQEHLLLGARGEPRLFANLNTAVNFLRGLGIFRFEVDASDYQPGLVRKARPDRAAALRQTRTVPIQRPLNLI